MMTTSKERSKWDAWTEADVDKWENKELGASKAHVKRASQDVTKNINDSLATRLVALRLPKDILARVRELAAEQEIGLQTYLRKLIERHVSRKNS